MAEQFADLPGWPGFRVSNHGYIIGRRGHRLKAVDKDGYRRVTLSKGGRSRGVRVHRAVVEAFLGPIPDGMSVNHKNGLKHDNRLENLEVCSHSENIRHAFRVLGTGFRARGELSGVAKLTEADVREMRRLRDVGAALKELSFQFDTSISNVHRIVTREIWAHVA